MRKLDVMPRSISNKSRYQNPQEDTLRTHKAR